MGLMFEVAEGGFIDIDAKIVGPDQKDIHEGWARNERQVHVCSSHWWVYTYCSVTRWAPWPRRWWCSTWMWEARQMLQSLAKEEAGSQQTWRHDQGASTSLTGVKHEQEYMQVRPDPKKQPMTTQTPAGRHVVILEAMVLRLAMT